MRLTATTTRVHSRKGSLTSNLWKPRLAHPLLLLLLLVAFLSSCAGQDGDSMVDQIDGSPVGVARGYNRREHSLTKPYGAGMDVPYWDIAGTAIISPDQIRLTNDARSMQGAIWNKMPVGSRDWELVVEFSVQGTTGQLYGDGMAIWYAQEPNQLGEVFGSKDYFRGLGVFLDTYSNHNGPHAHSHPYISAMVANGSLHYDHDSDGTHTSLGGEHTGCEAKFRNKDYTTQIMVRYVGDTLSIFTDFLGDGIWKRCMSVNGVHLPTNFYFGVSAATGDLSDNHGVLSVRMYEQEYIRVEKENEMKGVVEPYADQIAAPRDHVADRRPSRLGWLSTIVLVLVGIGAVVAALGFGLAFFQKRQERARKRFY